MLFWRDMVADGVAEAEDESGAFCDASTEGGKDASGLDLDIECSMWKEPESGRSPIDGGSVPRPADWQVSPRRIPEPIPEPKELVDDSPRPKLFLRRQGAARA